MRIMRLFTASQLSNAELSEVPKPQTLYPWPSSESLRFFAGHGLSRMPKTLDPKSEYTVRFFYCSFVFCFEFLNFWCIGESRQFGYKLLRSRGLRKD